MMGRLAGLAACVVVGASVTICGGAAAQSDGSDSLPSVLQLEDADGTRGMELPPGVALRQISAGGIKLIKDSEGWRRMLYNDSAHYCTIGYGHLVPPPRHRCDGTEPAEFLDGISEARGEEILRADLRKAEIPAQVLIVVPLNEWQHAAVVSLIFNIGAAAFQKSTLLKVLNDGLPFDDALVSYWFSVFVMAGGKEDPGLVKRRAREVDMFFAGIPRARGDAVQVREADKVDILPWLKK